MSGEKNVLLGLVAAVVAVAVVGPSCIPFAAREESSQGSDLVDGTSVMAMPSIAYALPAAIRNESPRFSVVGSRATKLDYFEPTIVEMKYGSNDDSGRLYKIEVLPKVLVVGQRDVEVSLSLQWQRRSFGLEAEDGDAFFLAAHDALGTDVRLKNVRTVGSRLVGVIPEVTEDMIGYKDLRAKLRGLPCAPVESAVRVVPKIRIALTFDDGPSIERVRYLRAESTGEARTPTESILDVLKERGIKAAFFVLTTPDSFLWQTHSKAETDEGFALIRRMVREGHAACAHWGGEYLSQSVLHTGRLCLPAYDYDGDSVVDKVSANGSALESDLLQCLGRIREAYRAEGQELPQKWFVRPPVWAYKDGDLDVRDTYADLGLKMILSDAKLYDGGYPLSGFTLESWMMGSVKAAIEAGHADIVITMHDSNAHTARDFRTVLARIHGYMAKMGFIEGTHWQFVKDSDEVLEILRTKERFHIHPLDA
jgi:peptidoglycan/xylan/chitin deacetylase (PgdA/CDA1 family)